MSTNTNFAQNRIGEEPYWVEYLANPYNYYPLNLATVDTGIEIGDIGCVHCTYAISNMVGSSLRGFGSAYMFFFGYRPQNSNSLRISTDMHDTSYTSIIHTGSVVNKPNSLYSVASIDGNVVTNNIYYTLGDGLSDATLIRSTTADATNIDLTRHFYLFYDPATGNSNNFNGRIYSCHIFDHDGNIISWLRPCLHPRTLTPAFYDLVRHRYLYVTGSNPIVTYGHTFIPAHYIRLTNTTVPEFKIWGVNSNLIVTQYSISPNPNKSRLDMGVRFKGSDINNIIRYPSGMSATSSSMIINGRVQPDNDSVFIKLIQDNGGSTAMEGIGYNSIGKVSNIIVRNDIDNNVCYFTSNGVTHTQPSSYLVERPDGAYPTIGSNPCVMDVESFSMRYTTPATSVQGVKPFGIYYDFQPCRIITEGENYGKSAFFDYVNAQYIISTDENNMSASEGLCTLTVQDALSVPTAQATAWQYNMP